jgi:hypothetical protein
MTTMKNKARQSEHPVVRHSAMVLTVSLALFLQILTPAGFMAGSIDDGWPVVLCPEGLPAGFLANGHDSDDAHHHHATDGATEGSAVDSACLFGSALDGSVAVSHAADSITAPPAPDSNSIFRRLPPDVGIYRRQLSRAPPEPT